MSRKNERINKHSKETYAYSTQLYWLDNSNSNKTLAPEQETVSKFQVSKCQNEDICRIFFFRSDVAVQFTSVFF